MTNPAASALLALTFTVAAAPLVLAVLRWRRQLDYPNDRSSHDQPTLRGLGLAPAIGGLATVLIFPVVRGPGRIGLILATGAFGAIGLVEDMWGVPPLRRIVIQAVAAGLSLVWLLDGITGSPLWKAAFALGCAFWLVAYVNAFNFMDGINGISAAQVLVASGTWWGIARAENVPALGDLALVAGGIALAFLPFNFPTARAFLGDVGSYFLGAWLAVLVVLALRSGIPPESVIAPLSLYLADTATTIVRRVRRRERWYLAHRDHAYQRLTQLGWSHVRVTLAITATMTLLSGLGALALSHSGEVRAAGDIGLGAVLVLYVLSPKFVARRDALTASSAPAQQAETAVGPASTIEPARPRGTD